MNLSKHALTALLFLFPLLPTASTAETPLEQLRVVALAPLEARAVVQSPDGALHVIGRGDALPGTSATVLQVLPDKLVVEEQTGGIPERGKQLAWLHKRPQAGGSSWVQRLQRQSPAAALPMTPPALNPSQR